MSTPQQHVTVLYAEDDEEDQMLAKAAMKRARLHNTIRFVNDGEELLDYLRQVGQYADPATAPRPGIILLDLNMPRMDGREALSEIRSDPNLRQIPVVVLTTSKEEEDILQSYEIGANSYLTKPVTFDKLVELIQHVGDYWFQVVQLPI
ncbi:response regulator [Candidatus Poribacteria bacterium]|jgi:two-component system, response regulator|nr:response regulator [Candidatus Poribacteria bacterium]MBT5532099.1 response regulator [Candidatus Poribacteria bacterium]MBT5714613.1 response regulator [Candidatus Poribacteria bacterium]MBT7098750.1 response regulator [Candidatus Poribacteria bacterium]MBT7805132.1 response regulator [Candidatus Poribacteria bacterium]